MLVYDVRKPNNSNLLYRHFVEMVERSVVRGWSIRGIGCL
jgi:hypothetical protein